MILMYKKFISSSEINKLNILKKISNSNGINLVTISHELTLPIKTIQKYIRLLNQDLNEIHETITIKKNHLNLYYLDLSNNSSSFYYSNLSYHYSLNSQIFRLVQYVIGEEYTTAQICNKLHISNSHLYRTIKQANQILDKFKIHITINRNQRLLFEGTELNIRVFIFCFLIQCVPSNVWIFPKLNKKEIINKVEEICKQTNASSATKKKLVNAIQTFYIRISKKNFLPTIDSQFETMFKFYSFFPLTTMQKNFPTLNNLYNEKLQNEYLYAGILFQVFIPNLVDPAYTLHMSEELFKSNKKSVHFFISMIKTWRDMYVPKINDKIFEEITRQSLLLFNLSIILDISILNTLDLEDISFNSKDLDEIHDIRKSLLTFAELYADIEFDIEFFKKKQLDYLAVFLYLETKMHYTPIVKIFINNRLDYRTIKFIQAKILAVFSENSIEFSNINPENSDLIITDRYEEIELTKKCIILSNYLDLYEWNYLFTSIKEILVDKML